MNAFERTLIGSERKGPLGLVSASDEQPFFVRVINSYHLDTGLDRLESHFLIAKDTMETNDDGAAVGFARLREEQVHKRVGPNGYSRGWHRLQGELRHDCGAWRDNRELGTRLLAEHHVDELARR